VDRCAAGDIYGAVYDASLEAVCEEVVMKHEAWLRSLPEGAELFRSGGRWRGLLEGSRRGILARGGGWIRRRSTRIMSGGRMQR